jgi:hypothetical protein
MGRGWTYKVLKEMVDNGRLTVDSGIYTITTHNPGHHGATGGTNAGQVAA